MKKVTSLDVAKLAGVSQTTVSLILSNNKKISFSSETREKVYEAARELKYKLPNQEAKPAEEQKKLIVVFVPTFANQYYSELTQSIELYAEKCGYHVMICNTSRKNDVECYFLEFCKAIRPEGIIYTFLPSFPNIVNDLASSIPVVLIGEKTNDIAVSSVELCNEKAGVIMMDYLLSIGHKYFTFISTPMKNFSMARVQRLEGIRSRLREHGLEDNLEIVYGKDEIEYDRKECPYEFHIGYKLAKDILEKEHKTTAFIGVNDITALGILEAIKKMGKSVPENYSVCGFDNIFSSTISCPALTTVDHHLGIRGKSAVDMLMDKIKAGKQVNGQSSIVNRIEYEPQLIVRDSTREPG